MASNRDDYELQKQKLELEKQKLELQKEKLKFEKQRHTQRTLDKWQQRDNNFPDDENSDDYFSDDE